MARPAKIDEKTGMVETGFSEKPSPVIELVDKVNPAKVIAWACSRCGKVLPDERLAREHCLPRICECGNECRQYHTACDACIKKKQVERDRVKREAAEVVSADDYDGPVYWSQEDQYFPGAAEAFDAVSDEIDFDDEKREEQTLWVCHKVGLTLDANDIVDGALENQEHHEEAASMISTCAIGALRDYLDDWVKKHASCVETWLPNETKRIVFPRRWWNVHDDTEEI